MTAAVVDEVEVPSPEVVDLVLRAQSGDIEAFGELYYLHVGEVYGYVIRRVPTREAAEDLTSEVFLRAMRAIGDFQWQGRLFRAWLCTIARNLITDRWRSPRSRRDLLVSEMPDASALAVWMSVPYADPRDATDVADTARAVRAALIQITADQRECLYFRYFADLSIQDTAVMMLRSPQAIRQLTVRALKALAAWLPEGLDS